MWIDEKGHKKSLDGLWWGLANFWSIFLFKSVNKSPTNPYLKHSHIPTPKQIEILVKFSKILKNPHKLSWIEMNQLNGSENCSRQKFVTKNSICCFCVQFSVQFGPFLGDWTIETDPELLCFPSTTAELHKTNIFTAFCCCSLVMPRSIAMCCCF